MSRWTEKFSYWSGIATPDGTLVFLLGRDDLMAKKVPHTVVARLTNGEWTAESYPFTSIGICAAARLKAQEILVGHGGEIMIGTGRELKPAEPIDIDRETGKVGYLRCARVIDGWAYIAGMDRQFYRRANGNWELLEANLPTEDELVVGFEAIDGYSEREIYTAGHEGEIWRFDGKKWHAITSPTNLILLGLHCSVDGFTYICGQAGAVIRGRKDTWEKLPLTGTTEDLWDITQFQGKVYVATRELLYFIDGDALVPVDFGDDIDIPFSFYRFLLLSDRLITIGAKDVMSFDGKTWSRID
jgi:hypothetical protein